MPSGDKLNTRGDKLPVFAEMALLVSRIVQLVLANNACHVTRKPLHYATPWIEPDA